MSAQARYQMGSTDRSQYLQRARHNALLTLPSLMPLDGRANEAHLIEPYQGLGAMGITHLSSRMAIGLLPAGRPYMRFDLPPSVMMQMEGEVPTDVTIKLSKGEAMVQSEVEAKGWREATLMSLQQLLVAGNVVEYMTPDNQIKQYRLDQYVVQFDMMGNLRELIIEEKFLASQAPLGLKMPDGMAEGNDDEELCLYTVVVRLPNGEYSRHQEWANGTQIGATDIFSAENLPYIPLGWTKQPGENYARAKVSEHVADLRSLDALEKAGLEMAAMASRNFIMVRPGATSASVKRRLVTAINGDVVVGDPEGVELKSFDNARGAQIVDAKVHALNERLARAFLLMSGGQRNAERVTATEIERDVAELEAALGGVFSSLANTMMKRRTELLIKRMIVAEKLPDFDGMVNPTILTGLEALSRERDVARALQAAQIVQAFGEAAQDVPKLPRILGRAFVGLGFADSVNTEEEVQQIQATRAEQAQQQMMIEKLGPEAVKQVGAAGQAQGGQEE